MIDKKELTRLSPEERIKKLKHMEGQRKKEVTEIEKLINESMQEIRTEKIAEEIAPKQKAVDISRLFQNSNETKLEKTAGQSSQKAATGYQTFAQTYNDYSILKEFHGVVAIGGMLSSDEKKLVGQIGERINVFEKYMSPSEKTANTLIASKMILYKLRKEIGLD